LSLIFHVEQIASMGRAVNLIAASASVAALASQPSLRAFLAKWTGVNAPGGVWRLLAILFALANYKNLPFVWHVRVCPSHPLPLYDGVLQLMLTNYRIDPLLPRLLLPHLLPAHADPTFVALLPRNHEHALARPRNGL
jgi:hypothetical protein